MKKLFCCPALELFDCVPALFICLPPIENSETTWKKTYKMQQKFKAYFQNIKSANENEYVSTYLGSKINDTKVCLFPIIAL